MPDSSRESRYRAISLLESLCRQNTIQLVVVDGDPVSKGRPRFCGNGRPYTPAKTIEGEKRIAARLAGVAPFKSNVAVACIFYRSSRQRIDVDNMLKAVLDAGTRAAIWQDDSQVTAILGIVEHDPERPRTVVCFGEHTSTLTRGIAAMIPCQTCGKLFLPGGKRRDKAKWCSRECGIHLAEPIDCPGCGKPFRRRSGYHKVCGDACRLIVQRRRYAAARAARTHCLVGHPLTEANTYIVAANGTKRCRRCQADHATAYRERKARAEASSS